MSQRLVPWGPGGGAGRTWGDPRGEVWTHPQEQSPGHSEESRQAGRALGPGERLHPEPWPAPHLGEPRPRACSWCISGGLAWWSRPTVRYPSSSGSSCECVPGKKVCTHHEGWGRRWDRAGATAPGPAREPCKAHPGPRNGALRSHKGSRPPAPPPQRKPSSKTPPGPSNLPPQPWLRPEPQSSPLPEKPSPGRNWLS